MTTAVAKRKVTPGVTLADVSAKILELTLIEHEQFAEFGRQLNHGDDAEPARRALQKTREQLSILFASRAQLEREASEQYDATKAGLSQLYRTAAEKFDIALDQLLKSLFEIHVVGSEIRSRAHAVGDPAADKFAALVYDPHATVNVLSEQLARLFKEQDPWRQARPSIWVQAQAAGLVEE